MSDNFSRSASRGSLGLLKQSRLMVCGHRNRRPSSSTLHSTEISRVGLGGNTRWHEPHKRGTWASHVHALCLGSGARRQQYSRHLLQKGESKGEKMEKARKWCYTVTAQGKQHVESDRCTRAPQRKLLIGSDSHWPATSGAAGNSSFRRTRATRVPATRTFAAIAELHRQSLPLPHFYVFYM